MDNELIEIYKKNIFTVANKSFTMNETDIANEVGNHFTIITAWNPNNEIKSLEENQAQNSMLKNDLIQSGYQAIPSIGWYNHHKEESFCIYDIELEDAFTLAKKYNQYSIFVFDHGVSSYYEVATLQKLSKSIFRKKR